MKETVRISRVSIREMLSPYRRPGGQKSNIFENSGGPNSSAKAQKKLKRDKEKIVRGRETVEAETPPAQAPGISKGDIRGAIIT